MPTIMLFHWSHLKNGWESKRRHRLLPPSSELRTTTACSLTSPPSHRSPRNLPSLPSHSHRANVEAFVAQVPHFSSSSSFKYRYTAPHPQNTNPRLLPHRRKGLTQRHLQCAQTPPCLRPVVCGPALLPHSTIGAASSTSRRQWLHFF
ncbi:hypothetical protein HN51_029542 [Arachis hypogaea]